MFYYFEVAVLILISVKTRYQDFYDVYSKSHNDN